MAPTEVKHELPMSIRKLVVTMWNKHTNGWYYYTDINDLQIQYMAEALCALENKETENKAQEEWYSNNNLRMENIEQSIKNLGVDLRNIQAQIQNPPDNSDAIADKVQETFTSFSTRQLLRDVFETSLSRSMNEITSQISATVETSIEETIPGTDDIASAVADQISIEEHVEAGVRNVLNDMLSRAQAL